MKRLLLLEDGSVFEGEAFGADVETSGEIVFSTGMTGYQESITDQSYNGQIITFTYPLIGNYGINRDDYESIRPTCKGVVIYEWAEYPSNWRQQMTLDEFLKLKGIPGISGIDTRALTKIIRKHGTMKACLINEGNSIHEALENLQKSVLLNDQIEQVSTKLAYASPGVGKNIVLVDFGLKHSILRELSQRQCHITVVPHTTTAQEILNLNPDGVLLSNGPGNPEQLPNALQMIQEIQGKIPIFGICMGHQLFAKANGAKTYKMTFGHRGFNHAVRHLQTGQVDFTSQNHGYAVSREDFPEALFITHEEINDKTVEGVRHKYYPAFSVQFHPDAAPGPHDTSYLFDEFINMIDDFHQKRSFMVLEVNDDINNGMQAMACQSLDESNHIVIAYSGTNAFNKKDILTDIDSVVLGKNNKLLTCPSSITLREDGISLPCKNPSQITTSKLFAQKIKMNYPDATLWLTGHSLGGYLAMIVASEMRLSARVFNSPSPINNMSEAATSYVISHPEKYHSYRINKDYIGNFGINSSDDKLGISKRVNAKKQHGFYKKIFFHELTRFRLNQQGQIVDIDENKQD